jgi:hypothetical protein
VAPDQGGALNRDAWLCFLDESGASLVPPVRRTWAPVGHTPVLRHRMRGRKRLSMAGVCCYRPDATDARLAFHLREGAYDPTSSSRSLRRWGGCWAATRQSS